MFILSLQYMYELMHQLWGGGGGGGDCHIVRHMFISTALILRVYHGM